MTEVLQSIPDTLLPLYEARTAHSAIALAIKMLQSASPVEQTNLLNDQVFLAIIKSALDGLDACRKQEYEALIDSLFPQNQILAHQNLG